LRGAEPVPMLLVRMSVPLVGGKIRSSGPGSLTVGATLLDQFAPLAHLPSLAPAGPAELGRRQARLEGFEAQTGGFAC